MRLFSASLALAALVASFAFGDDAEVLPNGVARLRLVPSFTTNSQGYDKDGKAQDAGDTMTLLGANGAFEFGLTDAVTLGLKWAPGFTYSTTHTKEANKHLLLNGPADLEIGGKLQILGAKGFVPNEQIRFALTPGISVPLDAYDVKAEGKRAAYGEDFRYRSASAHQSLGFGLKADADYVVNEIFFINLHSQALSYLPYEDYSFDNASTYYGTVKAAGQAAADAFAPLVKTKTTYGLEYTIELEPHAKFPVGGDSSVNLGVPLVYEASLADKSETAGVSTDEANVPSLLTVGPWASFFTLIGPLPVEFQAQYSLPLMGKSGPLLSTFSAQIKLFYKFY